MKKKKFIYGIICLMLAMSGCKGGLEEQEKQEEQNKQEEQIVVEKKEKFGILKDAIPMDETGTLKYISNEVIEEGTAQEIRLMKDGLLVYYAAYDKMSKQNVLFLKTLSTDTGELLNEIQLEGVMQANVQVCHDKITISDATNGKVTVLNETLDVAKEHSVKQCDNMFVDDELTKAYCFMNDDGLCVVNLENGEEELLLKNTHALYVSTYNENSVSMSYVDETTGFQCAAALDLATGWLEKLEIEDSFSAIEYSAGNWLAQINGMEKMYLLGNQQDPYKMQIPASNALPMLSGNGKHMMLTRYKEDGGQEWSAYGTDGTFYSQIQFGMEFTSAGNRPIWSEDANGYFFTIMNAEYKDQLFFWDFTTDCKGEGLEFVSYYQEEIIGGEILPQEYYDEAKSLSEKFGAVIRIADQCRTDYGNKYAVQEVETSNVRRGLDVLESTLSSYPENFFGQLYFGPYRRMEIHLVGEIDYYEKIEGHHPGAFVSLEDNKITMVLNINTAKDLLERTFYHETSHIIDAKLAYVAQYKVGALYSEEKWESLNPDNFPGYYGKYGELPEKYNDSSFGAYFLEQYSMTMPGEDRATVFEYAMMGDAVMFNSNRYAGRYAKLEYYCKCIRDTFDTTEWPAKTRWEEIL